MPRTLLPLGDSITRGWGDAVGPYGRGGYRVRLARRLRAVHAPYAFVGPLHEGDAPDDAHAGYGGATVQQIDGATPALLTAHRPDVVLLLAGTNNMTAAAAPGAPAALDHLVRVTLGQVPRLLVGTIPPVAGIAARVDAYNAEVRAVVKRARAAGQRVELVDVHRALSTSDLVDGTHPSAAGYEKMARVWFVALHTSNVRAGLAFGAAMILTIATLALAAVASSSSSRARP